MTETKKNETKQSIYERLSKINVKPYLNTIRIYAKKSKRYVNLSYLSWAKAWGLVKAIYPSASYHIKEYPNWVKLRDGSFQQAGTLDYRITSVGCEVEVTVTIDGHNFTQKLYPMDRTNSPILRPNIKDINKAQLRCLVKALATAGLGLNVYAGEDLPSTEDETAHKPEPMSKRTYKRPAPKPVMSKDDEAIWKHADKISDDVLKQYQVLYNGKNILMMFVVKGVNNDNADAKELAKTFKGKDKIAFDEIKKRKLVA